MRFRMYVDGFNLYYRLLRDNTGCKWLDLAALAHRLFPEDDLDAVRYYTARIKALGDPQAPQRQQIYLRALEATPEVSTHFGYFQIQSKRRRLSNPTEGSPKYAEVDLPEEKGSDVNLAAHLVADAFGGLIEKAVVVTNDADLAEPMRIVQHEVGLPVVLVHPTAFPATILREVGPASILRLSASTVRQCQFADELQDSQGKFTKPPNW